MARELWQTQEEKLKLSLKVWHFLCGATSLQQSTLQDQTRNNQEPWYPAYHTCTAYSVIAYEAFIDMAPTIGAINDFPPVVTGKEEGELVLAR